jgi:hypothetical protein
VCRFVESVMYFRSKRKLFLVQTLLFRTFRSESLGKLNQNKTRISTCTLQWLCGIYLQTLGYVNPRLHLSTRSSNPKPSQHSIESFQRRDQQKGCLYVPMSNSWEFVKVKQVRDVID